MKSLLRRFTEGPVRTQFSVLLLGALVAAHLLGVALVAGTLLMSGTGRPIVAAESVGAFRTLLNVVSALDSVAGEKAILAAIEGDRQFTLVADQPAQAADPSKTDEAYEAALLGGLPEAFRAKVKAYIVSGGVFSFLPGNSLAATVQLDDGRWLVFEQSGASIYRILPFVQTSLAATIFIIPLAVLVLWLGSALLKPIANLASGAERFSVDLGAPPIKEGGAREIRIAARALNGMRNKVRALVERRSQTLAAIGHDMRTPLTRMRLRAESIEEAELRDAFRTEIANIDRMVTSALAFIRSEHTQLNVSRVDIAVLGQTVVDDFVDRGHQATFVGAARLTLECDADLMRRLLENLCSNSCNYAGSVEVAVKLDGTAALLEVSDHGEGIPEEKRQLVLEPFAKLDRARSSSGGSSGFGLGLATVKNIVDQHRGTIRLSDNVPNGLKVSVRIPLVFSVPGPRAQNTTSLESAT